MGCRVRAGGAMIRHAQRDQHRGYAGRSRALEAIVADRSAPQKHVWRAHIILPTAEGCGTAEIMRRSGKSKPVVWRWQARFMAEGVDGLHPRQDAQARQTTAAADRRAAGGRSDARPAAGRCNPLDRPDAGESGRREPAFGATHLASPPTGAASHPHLQAVERPEVRRRSSRTLSASTSIRPPMRSFCRSTRRAKSRRSTAPSRGCR